MFVSVYVSVYYLWPINSLTLSLCCDAAAVHSAHGSNDDSIARRFVYLPGARSRRLYILCWSELSRRKLSPTLATPTTLVLTTLVAQCELSRRKIGLLLEVVGRKFSHRPGNPATVGVVRWPAAGDTAGSSLRRPSSLQHRIYNLLGPDLQNILRQSYDYLTIMAKLRPTYDRRLIYKKNPTKGARLFLGTIYLQSCKIV